MLQTPLYIKYFVVMQENTTAKRQKSRNGSSVPTKKCVIRGEKSRRFRSNIPPHYKMPTTIFLNAAIKIYEFYLATVETIEINLILQIPL